MMATYDYRCPKCKDKFDRFVLKKNADIQKCFKCDVIATRVLSATPTTFKFADKK